MSTEQQSSHVLSRNVTAVAYVVILLGQYSLNRIGATYSWPIPINALAAIASLLVLMFALTSAFHATSGLHTHLKGFRLIIGYFVVLMLSGLWSSAGTTIDDSDYWNLIALVAILVLLRFALALSPKTVLDTFMGLSVIAGIAFSVAGLALAGDIGRVAAFGGGPNTFARVTGMAMVAVIYFVITGRRRPWFALLLAPLAAATVLSGSRGAMLGSLVGLAVLAVAIDKLGWRRMAAGLAVASPIVAFVYFRFGALILQAIQLRIVRLSFEEHYTSGREGLYSQAWAMFHERPLVGSGLGSFAARYGPYPHNLILQTAAEAGVVGLIMLILIFIVCVSQIIGPWFRDPAVLAPFASASLILTASMFSGGYYDTRYLWAYLIIGVAQCAPTKSRIEHKRTVVLETR